MSPLNWYRKLQRRSQRRATLDALCSEAARDPEAALRWLDERLAQGEREEIEAFFEEIPDPFALPVETYGELIERSYRAELFEVGLRLAAAWRRSDPESARPLNQAARLHSLAGRFEQAHELHRLALALPNDEAESHYQLGCTLLRENRNLEAEAALREALACDPRLAKAHTNLGFSLDRRGERDEAILHFRRAIQLDPRNAMGHLNLGALYGERGDFDQAIHLFKTTVELAPDSLEGRMSLGLALANCGRYGEALAEFESVLAMRPQQTDARFHIALCHSRLGAHRKALAELERADASDPRVRFYLGLCHVNLGEYAKGLPFFLQVLELHPDDARSHYYLGIIYDQLGQGEAARQSYRRAEALGHRPSVARAAGV